MYSVLNLLLHIKNYYLIHSCCLFLKSLKGLSVSLDHKPDKVLSINLCRMREYKYYGITSTTFGTGTHNIRCVEFPGSAFFRLPGK